MTSDVKERRSSFYTVDQFFRDARTGIITPENYLEHLRRVKATTKMTEARIFFYVRAQFDVFEDDLADMDPAVQKMLRSYEGERA